MTCNTSAVAVCWSSASRSAASLSLRSVMSLTAPTSRMARPAALRIGSPWSSTQRYSPLRSRMRYSQATLGDSPLKQFRRRFGTLAVVRVDQPVPVLGAEPGAVEPENLHQPGETKTVFCSTFQS